MWVMLGWLLFTQIVVAFVGRSVGPLAPFLEGEFDLTKAQVGLLPAALFAGQSIVSIPAGWITDRIGTRKMLVILSTVCGVSFLLAGISKWYALVLLAIVLGGCGYGAMQPCSNRGIIYWFPQKLAGTAMGIKQMGVTGGSALAALVLVPIALNTDWRFAMTGAAILLLGVGVVSFLFYRDPPVQKDAQNDEKREQLSFVPTLKILIRNKPLVLMSIAAMFLTSAQLSLTTYIIMYVSESLLYPLFIAAVFLSLSEISGSLGRVVWGIISDRLFDGERAPVLVLIAVLTAACAIVTAVLPPYVSMFILVPVVFLFGFSIAGYNGLWMNIASETVPRTYAGMASGFSLSLGSLGVIFGPPLFGFIVDMTGGYKSAWIFVSVEMLVVIGLLLLVRKELRQVNNNLESNMVK